MARGARVAGCARGAADLDSLDAELPGADALLLSADVTVAAAVARFVDAALSRWGRIDGLINNASILGERAPLRELDVDAWRRTLDVGLTGAFLVSRAVLPSMRAAGAGSIVNVSSGVGDQPRENWGAYAVAKRALEGFSWNLALEERSAGVRVNVVDPGRMRTDMRRAAYPDEDPDTLPEPADSTAVFVWLMHPASAGTTGQRLQAHGWTPPRMEPARRTGAP